jgi:hypothetical protein
MQTVLALPVISVLVSSLTWVFHILTHYELPYCTVYGIELHSCPFNSKTLEVFS